MRSSASMSRRWLLQRGRPEEWRLLIAQSRRWIIDGFRWCLPGGNSPLWAGFIASLGVAGFSCGGYPPIPAPNAPSRIWCDDGRCVIRAEGLGKKFTIGHQAECQRYEALRDVLARSTRRLLRKGRDMLSGRPVIEGDEFEEFWALRDLNFEIRRGEVVSIIGHNGSGKSTLLKILSRITDPSAGRVEVAGRVASLLEVGTGFHPELTGRENVFLNGSILGMSQAEIRHKFDEIVAFAEVEKFLDTPVKHYSANVRAVGFWVWRTWNRKS